MTAWSLLTSPLAIAASGTDDRINEIFAPVAKAISVVVFYPITLGGEATRPAMVLWLMIAATFFTIYSRFINVRGFKQGLRLICGDYSNRHDAGEVTHFQALSTALSGTFGLGNIAGVAIAISIRGQGATFWMIVAGFLGMSTKFVECTLGVKYRRHNPDGSVSGGPMHYLSRGIAEHHPRLAGFGKVLAVVFSICCIGGSLGGGNMFQINQTFQQFVNISGGESSVLAGNGWLFGMVMAVMVGAVIIGGIKSIARVTDKLVPFMAILYLACGVYRRSCFGCCPTGKEYGWLQRCARSLAGARLVKRFAGLPPAEIPFCSHRNVAQRCARGGSVVRRIRTTTRAGYGVR